MYYTDKERRELWTYDGECFRFITHKDLSCGVKVVPHIYNGNINEGSLAKDVSMFIFYWIETHLKHLNGFSGLDTVRWQIYK